MGTINLKAKIEKNLPKKKICIFLRLVRLFSFIFVLKKCRDVLANDFSFKYCLIAILTVFLWTFNLLAGFLIDVVGSFLITVATIVKTTYFRFLFYPLLPLFLKIYFPIIFFLCFVYGRQRNSCNFGHFFLVWFRNKANRRFFVVSFLAHSYWVEF